MRQHSTRAGGKGGGDERETGQEGWLAAGSGVAEAAAVRARQTKSSSTQRATPHGWQRGRLCGLDKPRGGGTPPGQHPAGQHPRLVEVQAGKQHD